VEFALVVPVFLAFIFGIVEGSRLMEAQQAVTAAARAGAREAALSGSTAASTSAAALGPLTAAGISTAGISPILTPSDPATAAADSSVTVQVTVPYSSVSWLGFYFQGVHLTTTITLRKED
jgi:Flp pilus assembly protein TadG